MLMFAHELSFVYCAVGIVVGCAIAADPSQMTDKSALLCREDFLRVTEFGKCSADCALMCFELCAASDGC